MKSHNFCHECGASLNKDMKNCPNCGEPIIKELIEPLRPLSNQKPIEKDRIPITKKRKKPLVKKLGFFSWILLLIGSAIGFYALTTPAGSVRVSDIYSWDMWMFGYNRVVDMGVLDVFWVGNEELLTVSIVSTVFVIIGNIVAIISAGSLIIRGIHTTYAAIAAPIILAGSALFYLGGYQVLMFFGTGESFWSLMNPAFAVYGQFAAAAFMAGGFFIARGASKYSEPLKKEFHQEKVFNMLKTIVETKFLVPSERDQLNKELDVISLRLKGVVFLKKKIEMLTSVKPTNIQLEETQFDEGLKYFQEALELSSSTQLEISKKDIELAKKVLEQQDEDIALFYLKEISDHTTILIGDIFKRLST
ncbi:MAG: zinc ribbon domain-containing protein [Promethearchaeota archaeon]